MNKVISFGLSPCPNDTFSFYAMLHNKIPMPFAIEPHMADVECLNQWALQGRLAMTKVSFGVLGHILKDYVLLPSGSALGRECGPLIVAKKPLTVEDLRGLRVAIPGEHTTAALLLRLYMNGGVKTVSMPFGRIVEAVSQGQVNAGVIIHETRFTYGLYGLQCVVDLGEWWERQTGLPIPLGGIVAKRHLAESVLQDLNETLKISVLYARSHREEPMAFVRQHAQEMDVSVMKQHIALYVTSWTVDLGQDGRKAVEYLVDLGRELGLWPGSSAHIFI